MNLDDLLKSIREEDDDSKGGRINADKLKSKTFINPLKGQRFTAPSLPHSVLQRQTKPVVIKIEPDKLIPNNDDTTKELIESINQLVDVIKADNDLEKQRQDNEKKQKAKEKRKKREERIEGVKKILGITRTTKKAIKKVQDIFDTVLRFLGFTLLGQIVKFVTDFLGDPKNKKFLEDAQNFIRGIPDKLREVRDKLIPVVDWFKEQGPKIAKFAEDFRKLIAKFPFLGQYFKTKEEKDADQKRREEAQKRREQAEEDFGPFGILKGGGMLPFLGTDTVPAMLTPGEFIMSRGAVNKFGIDFMESVNAMGGGTNRPKFGRVAYAAGGGLLDFIGSGEGTYDSMNQGTDKSGKIVGSALNSNTKIGKKLTDMTIGEIKERQRYIMDFNNPQISDYGIFAAGKYQIIPDNMATALRGTGLTDDDMFSPANQDKMGMNLIMNKAGREKLSAYLRGTSDDVIGAQVQLAKEFASVPVPIDMMGAYGPVKAGQSYYAGDGNKAGHSVAETRAALEKQRKSNLSASKTKKSAPTPPTPPPAPTVTSAIEPTTEKKPVDDRFSGVDLDFIFKPIREFLRIDTPNVPTKTSFIVLPTIQEKAQQPGVQVDNEIPNFKISSGVRMRGLVGKALGIEDLVS
jgi:hypothetical protein